MTPRTWMVLTFGLDRQYAGNEGYADDPRSSFGYDSLVPNHKHVRRGDLVIIRNPKHVVGVGRIENIRKRRGTKLQSRCPTCNTTALKSRTTLTPRYRCVNGHEFQTPLTQQKACMLYRANYGGSFVDSPDAVSVATLRNACIRPSDQLAIQQVDLLAIRPLLLAHNPELSQLLTYPDTSVLRPTEALESEPNLLPYSYAVDDLRDTVLREIRRRRGQQRFRDRVRERFNDRCAISGCAFLDILEAAHVDPYSGPRANHPANGLLLRADLHTLFDLNLIGIHPHTYYVHLHPSLRTESDYAPYEGTLLACVASAEPDAGALTRRWSRFQAQCSGGSSDTGTAIQPS
jgi:hypothetical protein